MRKFSKFVLAVMLAAALTAVPLSASYAIITDEGPPPPPPHHHHKPKPPHSEGTDQTGAWIVGCVMASSGALIVGSAVKANDRNDPRQLTVTEAAWLAAICPGFLPLALLTQSACPDNKATYEIARLAFRFLRNHPVGDQTPFTNAYAEACSTGKLSRATRSQLRSLI
jgi:hypothetical protein